MIKSDETHCELTLRPDDFLHLPQFGTGWQNVEVSSSSAPPTLFLNRVSFPAGFFKTTAKLPESVEVQCDRRIDICRETIFVRKVQLVRNCSDDDEIRLEFFA